MSIIRGVETYDHYDNVIVVWGTRIAKELPFRELIESLNTDEILVKLQKENLEHILLVHVSLMKMKAE